MDLFSPTTLCKRELKNHFVRSATHDRSASETGHVTDAAVQVYERLAAGGIGGIFTGYANIYEKDQPSSRMLGIYNDSHIAGCQRLTEMAHRYHTPIFMQIVYGGSQGQGEMSNGDIWGPSAVLNEKTGKMSVEMQHSDIKQLIGFFADAAVRTKKAGFDGVQLHAAHGYLLSQFLSPYYNRRNDQYGGSAENRARLLLEVYHGIREAVGKEYPVMMKINSSDNSGGGLTYEDSMLASKLLASEGMDAIEISGGGPFPVPKSKSEESYFKDYAMELAGEVSIPVILTGGNRSLEVMQEIAGSSEVHLFGLSRPLVADPEYVKKLQG